MISHGTNKYFAKNKSCKNEQTIHNGWSSKV